MNFSTVVFKHCNGDRLPYFSHETPQIILPSNTSIPIGQHFNRNIFIVLVLETLFQLDLLAYELRNTLDARILLLNEMFSVHTVFEKCFQLDLPNIFVTNNGSFYSYCFSSEIRIFKLSEEDIFRSNWFENFKIYDCTWPVEVISIDKFGLSVYSELLLAFSQQFNGVLHYSHPKKKTMPTLSFVIDGHNGSYYEINRYLEYMSVVLVVPAKTVSISKFLLLVAPFEVYTWIAVGVITLYFLAVLYLIGYVRGDTSLNSFTAIEIVLGKGVKLFHKDTFYRLILLLMILYSFAIVTIYTTFLGSLMIKSSGNKSFEIVCEPKRLRHFLQFNPSAEVEVNWRMMQPREYLLEITNLNLTQGYCLYSQVWDVYHDFQKSLITKGFRVLDEWKIPTYVPLLTYLRKNFRKPYDEYFLVYVYSGGLLKFWCGAFYQRNYIRQIIKTTEEDESSDLRLDHFNIIFIVHLMGCVAGGVSLLVEVFIKRK